MYIARRLIYLWPLIGQLKACADYMYMIVHNIKHVA
jgi:hypothetical protein